MMQTEFQYVVLVMAVCTVFVCGAPKPEQQAFVAKAEKLFRTSYSFHAWKEENHVIEGNDWSLPPWVKASQFSGISINAKKLSPEFPGRIQRSVNASWHEVEPTEGTYDFSGIRERILRASDGGKNAVKLGIGASVWETRYFKSLGSPEVVRTTPGTAPVWLKDYGIEIIEEHPNRSIPFQVVNMDIYNPEYHRRYVAMVHAFGKSGIPQMKELDLCYLHLKSASRGEEGTGPNPGSPERTIYEERLRAWAEAFEGVAYKLCNVSGNDIDLQFSTALGMGQRNGFVEHYLLHVPNPMLGQILDPEGYLVVDESNPIIAENRASGDENEEYTRSHEARFGPIETFPHRYRESMLRVLQMRRNFIWAEGDKWLINPPLLHYVALELGKTVQTAPDAWCYLRESYVPDRIHKNWKTALPVKNFERWVFQRDLDGARTIPTERVNVPKQMFEFHKGHLYDYTARRTDLADGQDRIVFGVDDSFLSGGPHRVAIKITYVDHGTGEWLFEYHTGSGELAERSVRCADSGTAKTITFVVNDACFPGVGYKGMDMQIRAMDADATIRFIRIIKLTPP